MRLRPQHYRRSGATMAETGVVLLTFLIIVLAIIDLGVAVFRQNAIAEAARLGSRIASVHGELATTGNRGVTEGPWGTSTITGTANTSDTGIIGKVSVFLQDVVPLSQTTITVEWPGVGYKVGQPVRVTVTTTYQPMLTLIFNGSFSMTAASTSLISH